MPSARRWNGSAPCAPGFPSLPPPAARPRPRQPWVSSTTATETTCSRVASRWSPARAWHTSRRRPRRARSRWTYASAPRWRRRHGQHDAGHRAFGRPVAEQREAGQHRDGQPADRAHRDHHAHRAPAQPGVEEHHADPGADPGQAAPRHAGGGRLTGQQWGEQRHPHQAARLVRPAPPSRSSRGATPARPRSRRRRTAPTTRAPAAHPSAARFRLGVGVACGLAHRAGRRRGARGPVAQPAHQLGAARPRV